MTRGDRQRGERASFRINPEVLARLRALVRDHAGKPLYLEIGTFVEQAIITEMDRIEARMRDAPLPPEPPAPPPFQNHRRVGLHPTHPTRLTSSE